MEGPAGTTTPDARAELLDALRFALGMAVRAAFALLLALSSLSAPSDEPPAAGSRAPATSTATPGAP